MALLDQFLSSSTLFVTYVHLPYSGQKAIHPEEGRPTILTIASKKFKDVKEAQHEVVVQQRPGKVSGRDGGDCYPPWFLSAHIHPEDVD